jgi:hypothetical protein
VVQENGGDAAETRLAETFVRWNRPHKLAANVDFRFDDDGPFDWDWAKHSGINFYVQGTSGRAYTPINVFSAQAAEPNSKNGIFQITTDLRLNHYFLFGRQRLDIGLSATNLFNNYIINRVDRVTGHGRVWGEGEYDPPLLRGPDRLREGVRGRRPVELRAGAQWRTHARL